MLHRDLADLLQSGSYTAPAPTGGTFEHYGHITALYYRNVLFCNKSLEALGSIF